MTQLSEKLAGEYLTFHLGEDDFALEVTKAREVLDVTTITKVPQTPNYMLGVINLRGRVVPVVDLHVKFGLPPTEQTVDTCIIVMELDIEGEATVVGALADSVSEVIEFTPAQIEPPPKLGSGLKVEFIKGMGKRDERFIILLNIEKIFTTEELMQLHRAGGEAETAAE